jgi:Prokaryotic E2 family E
MLSDGDETYLNEYSFDYEVVPEGAMFALIIRDFRLPAGYEPAVVDLLLRLPGGFPDAAPDMFWMHPVVAYATGGSPPATETRLEFEGRIWQRWSRHLAVAWRPGVDNLQTYLRLIRTDLEKGAPALVA